MNRQPTWRKPVGMLAIVGIIALWAIVVASCAPWIGRLPFWLEAAVYVIAGIVWIFPMRPLLVWMETGRWRVPHI